jgi:hypothetical protein
LIKKWWERLPFAEFAFVVTPRIVVLDLDGVQGRRDFERLAGFPLDEFQGPIATTPRGGLHLFCAAQGREYVNTVKLAGTAIDVRGHGAYVLLPGAGNGRDWIDGKPTKPGPIPPAIVKLMKQRAQKDAPGASFSRSLANPAPTRPSNGHASRYGRVTLELACRISATRLTARRRSPLTQRRSGSAG